MGIGLQEVRHNLNLSLILNLLCELPFYNNSYIQTQNQLEPVKSEMMLYIRDWPHLFFSRPADEPVW